MNSKTKNVISNEKITELVKANFGYNTAINNIIELKGGMFNSAYLIVLGNPLREMVLKVAAAPEAELLTYEKDIMRTEIAVYKIIESKTSIPVPKILKYDFSRKLICSDYFFMTKLNGRPWKEIKKELSKEDKVRLKEEIGMYTAQLHSINGDYFGYFSDKAAKQYTTWGTAFLAMVENIISDGKKHGVKLSYDEIISVVKDNIALMDDVREPSLIDFDLWAGNVFLIMKEGSYVVEGIVDFERAFWGDPYADFISSIMIYDDVLKELSFQKGYNSQHKVPLQFTNKDKCRMLLYRIYMSLILAVESYRYNKVYGFMIKIYSKSCIKRYIKEVRTYNLT